MPSANKVIDLDLHYSAAAMSAIRCGFRPQEMDDRWLAYMDGETLCLHRSWSGYCIFEVRFSPDGAGFRAIKAIVNRDPAQYRSDGDDADQQAISAIINGYFLSDPQS
jgi:hypothetical protein